MFRVGFVIVCLSLVTLAGCGKGDPHNRQAVSGTVSLDGKPIAAGKIQFVPEENQQTTVTVQVADGGFTVNSKAGLAPGKYSVIVTGPLGAVWKETATIKVGETNEVKYEFKTS